MGVTLTNEDLVKIRPRNGLGGVAVPESWWHQVLLGVLGWLPRIWVG